MFVYLLILQGKTGKTYILKINKIPQLEWTKYKKKTKLQKWQEPNNTYTNTTSRITLSNLRYSQHVFISKSTNNSRICTVSIDLYLVKDSFILSCSVFSQNFFSWKHYGVCVCLYLLCYSSDRYYVLIYLVTQLSCVIDYYTISKRGYLSSILWYM